MAWRGLLAIGTALGLACGGPAAAASAGVPAWEVTAPSGATSIVLGGLQRPAAGLLMPAPAVVQGKSRLVLMLDRAAEAEPFEPGPAFVDPAAMAETGRTGGLGRAPWASKLTDAQIDQMRTNARCFMRQAAEEEGEPVDPALDASDAEYWLRIAVGGRDPYFALALAAAHCMPPGTRSRESVLREAAAAADVPVVAVDSTTQLYARYWSTPVALLKTLLYQNALTPLARQDLQRLVDALNAGDLDALAQASKPSGLSASEQKRFDRLMVFDAVDAILPKLEVHLGQGNALVVFDAGKLSGEYGLLPKLTQAGYTVKPIALPADGAPVPPRQGG